MGERLRSKSGNWTIITFLVLFLMTCCLFVQSPRIAGADLGLDFGRAWDPGYPTFAASYGARHTELLDVAGQDVFCLGPYVDHEPDATQPVLSDSYNDGFSSSWNPYALSFYVTNNAPPRDNKIYKCAF